MIEDIVLNNRQKGSTTWILEAALNNPNVIIICYDESNCKDFKKIYDKFLYDRIENEYFSSFWTRLFNPNSSKWINNKINEYIRWKDYPLFISKNSWVRTQGYDKPIIFDNSSLI